jgi:serine/threonine-protein kinase SRK2
MGSCFSSSSKSAPHDKAASQTNGTKKHHATPTRASAPAAAPDEMLARNWEYVKHLGKGGSGDTGLFKAVRGGEEVAIKLIKRPLPKIVMPNILREITVR